MGSVTLLGLEINRVRKKWVAVGDPCLSSTLVVIAITLTVTALVMTCHMFTVYALLYTINVIYYTQNYFRCFLLIRNYLAVCS